jgi:hypothetical protein
MGSVRKGQAIDAALCKKGFRRETGGDHICYFLVGDSGDDTDIKTKISHGAMGDTIGANLVSRMARQVHLSKAQFLALIDCTLDKDGYRKILNNDEQ